MKLVVTTAVSPSTRPKSLFLGLPRAAALGNLGSATGLIVVWLAVLAMCFWPLAAGASCCCSKVTQVASANDDATAELAATGGLDCCGNPSRARGEMEAVTPTCAVRGSTADNSGKPRSNCECELSCCHFAIVTATPPNPANDRSLSVDFGQIASFGELYSFAPHDDQRPTLTLGTGPVLDADERCALLSRWLK